MSGSLVGLIGSGIKIFSVIMSIRLVFFLIVRKSFNSKENLGICNYNNIMVYFKWKIELFNISFNLLKIGFLYYVV